MQGARDSSAHTPVQRQRERSEAGPLLRLSIPIIATELGQMSFGTVDTIIAGQLSVRALDAVALGNLWQVVTMMPLLGVVLGLDPLVSQAHGAGRGDQVGLFLQRALLIACALSVLTVLAWGQTEQALTWLAQEPELARAAATYVGVQRFSAVGFLLYGALSSYLVSRGIVRPGLVAIVLANVFNGCAAWTLTFGSFGLPALGLRGLGLATGLTRILLPLVSAWLIVQFGLYKGAWTPWSRRVLEGPALHRQLLLGLPMGITIALELGSFQAGTLIAGKLGAVSLGAHAIALNLSALFFMVPLGFSIGTSAHVGQLIGAELPERAQRAAHAALKLIAGYALCAGGVFALGRHVLPALYTDDAPILAAAATVLPIAGAFQMVDGLQAAGSGILRGMGRPRITALVNLLGYFVIAMPFAYYTALHTSLGLRGIWLGYALGLSCTALGLVSQVLLRGPRTVKPL